MNGTESRTNIRTEKRKLYTPQHKRWGIRSLLEPKPIGEVGEGCPLQVCRWTDFAKSKNKRVKAKKLPKFNKKKSTTVIYSSWLIPYQLTKFQASSSNSFRYILLTRFHSDFFLKGHNARYGHNSDKKKKYGLVIFHEESRYEIYKNKKGMFGRGLLKEHFCKSLSKYLQWDCRKGQVSSSPL